MLQGEFQRGETCQISADIIKFALQFKVDANNACSLFDILLLPDGPKFNPKLVQLHFSTDIRA